MKTSLASLAVLLLVCACSTSFHVPDISLEEAKLYQVGFTFDVSLSEPVRAISDGVVVAISNESLNPSNLGRYVIVAHNLYSGKADPDAYFSVYGMLGKLTTKVGDKVDQNTILAFPGATGPLSEIYSGSTFFFGIFSQNKAEALESQLGKPVSKYGVQWYDARKILGDFTPRN